MIVMLYIFLGGLTSAIYNEVMQFFLIVAGFVPLVFLGLQRCWRMERSSRACDCRDADGFAPGAFTQAGRYMGDAASNPMGVEWFGLAMGLGFVLSFGYWTTDFLVVQRAMAADSMSAARRTPLIAAVPRCCFRSGDSSGNDCNRAYHSGGRAASHFRSSLDGSLNYDMTVP